MEPNTHIDHEVDFSRLAARVVNSSYFLFPSNFRSRKSDFYNLLDELDNIHSYDDLTTSAKNIFNDAVKSLPPIDETDNTKLTDIISKDVNSSSLARADFVQLPGGVKGTNCGNCRHNTDGVCHFYDEKRGIDLRGLKVTERDCCAEWDAEGTERPREVRKSIAEGGRKTEQDSHSPSEPADDTTRQPVRADIGYDRLKNLAERSLPLFLELLSNLECEIHQIDRMTPDSLREALSPPGPCIIVGGVKGEERSTEKVNNDYGGDWSKLFDILRATVAVDKERDIRRAVETLEESGAKYARPPKDRFENPLPNGYRDFLANYVLPNGFIVEVQFTLKNLAIVRQESNEEYRRRRSDRKLTDRERQDVVQQIRGRMDAEYRETEDN